MAKVLDTPVLIVGGGPIGLTLAIDLAWRGIDVVVAEKRRFGEATSVKCNHVSARSMEIYRRLGIVAKIRNAGLPPDYPNDCSYRTTTTGVELARIPIPCRRDRYTATGGPDTWWPTPEPPHRINQIFLEPILDAHAATLDRITLLHATSIDDFFEHGDGVAATARNLETGEVTTIGCRYLVGCDGARSGVRKRIGAVLEGAPVVQRVQSSYIRAPRLLSMLQSPPAWVMFSLNPRRCGNVMAIDGRETWLVHNYLHDDEPDFDTVDRDWAIRTILGVDATFDYTLLGKEDWVGRRLVADRFRRDRVFLCGDAAHVWVPYAGYGMNAGIADAANLAWLLAARLVGWGADALLDAYEAERRPITEQVSHFAMNHAHSMAAQRRSVPEAIERHDAEGEAARSALGRAAYELNVQQYCCGGLNFGYYYDASPIIAYDGEPPPRYTMDDFTPSTVPGCRTPHVWLDDGRSLYDALGADYTLLRFDRNVDVRMLVEAARSARVPLDVLDVSAEQAPAVYRHKLVLSRPDQHVAWRGDAVPPDADRLIAIVSGWQHAMRVEPALTGELQ